MALHPRATSSAARHTDDAVGVPAVGARQAGVGAAGVPAPGAPDDRVAVAALRGRSDPQDVALLDDHAAASLSTRMVAGETEALGALYEARVDWMIALLARTIRRDESFVHDCVQDAWLRIARQPVRCPTVAALDGWLRRVALSAALDRLRSEGARRLRERATAGRDRRGRELGSARSTIDPSHGAAHERRTLTATLDAIESLHRALDRSGAEERGLLLLRYRAGLTIAQIGATLGVGAAAVDSRLRRALGALRDEVER